MVSVDSLPFSAEFSNLCRVVLAYAMDVSKAIVDCRDELENWPDRMSGIVDRGGGGGGVGSEGGRGRAGARCLRWLYAGTARGISASSTLSSGDWGGESASVTGRRRGSLTTSSNGGPSKVGPTAANGGRGSSGSVSSGGRSWTWDETESSSSLPELDPDPPGMSSQLGRSLGGGGEGGSLRGALENDELEPSC